MDEMGIPLKGRSVMKQYIRYKPHKWGLTDFALASKSGIVHNFEIHVATKNMGISGRDIVVAYAWWK